MTIVKFTTRARFNGRDYEPGQEAFADADDVESLAAAGYISLTGEQAAEPNADGASAQAPPSSDEVLE